jgi:ABC-type Fe3+ transport system substrate-binding protein
MGKEKAQQFISSLAATKPVLVESFLPAAKRVTTGETPIAITYIKYAYIFGKEGAPLDYVRLPIMLGDGHYIALSNKAPHPDAGKAFIDFFLGRESMNIMAKLGEFVNRKESIRRSQAQTRFSSLRWVNLARRTFAIKD